MACLLVLTLSAYMFSNGLTFFMLVGKLYAMGWVGIFHVEIKYCFTFRCEFYRKMLLCNRSNFGICPENFETHANFLERLWFGLCAV